MQPTYLHKHDAPLCFPFSLRAPALHLREKMRERGAAKAEVGDGGGLYEKKVES